MLMIEICQQRYLLRCEGIKKQNTCSAKPLIQTPQKIDTPCFRDNDSLHNAVE